MGRQFTAVSQEEIVHFIKNNINYFHDDNNKSLESSSHKSELINYFEGRVTFEELSKVLQAPQTYSETYLHNTMEYSLLNDRILPFPSELSQRIYRFIFSTPNAYHFAKQQATNRKIPVTELLRELETYAFPTAVMISVWYPRVRYYVDTRELIETEPARFEWLLRHQKKLFATVAEVPSEVKTQLVVDLARMDQTMFAPMLQILAGDSSKAVRDAVAQVMSAKRSKYEDFVRESLFSKKQTFRECAVSVLSNWNDERSISALMEAYSKEGNEKLRSLIESSIKRRLPAEPLHIDDLERYCRENTKRGKSKVDWLPWNVLPKVNLVEISGNPLVCLEYLASCYAVTGRISVPLEAIRLAGFFDSTAMGDWCLALLTDWHEHDSDSKRKWVLSLCAYHGDDRIIVKMKEMIADWPIMGRTSIACDAVRALAVSDKDEALRLVDAMSRKYKSRPVKLAAEQAFAYAAAEQGIDPEELADRIIPDFGFTMRGELTLSYGSRSFEIRLNEKLEPILFDQAGKKLKSLPQPGAKDDEETAVSAQALYKEIKKQLKATAKGQLLRLQSAITAGRTWQAAQWRKCFLNNPLMQIFATGLIWTVDADDETAVMFRSMGDGTLTNILDEQFDLPDIATVKLAHPVEMTEDDVQAWLSQLYDYEVKQPLPQLNRATFLPDSDLASNNYLLTYAGRQLSGLTLTGRMLMLGWVRGPAGDGGNFDYYLREEPMCGCAATLTFSGMYSAMDAAMDQTVTIYELEFFQRPPGAPSGWIYQASESGSQQMNVGETPIRFYSDVIHEIEQATDKHFGVNEKWREEHWRKFESAQSKELMIP